MKIIVTAEKQVHVEVQPNEGQAIAFTDVVGILELAKAIVLAEWKEQLAKVGDEEDVENNETSGDN